MLVIPVPPLVYVLFLVGLSAAWVIWIVSDLAEKGLSKHSVKRVLAYVASGAILAVLWGVFIG